MKARIPASKQELDKIDVIIPFYNASKTIDRCLSSLVMQTIVNDLKVTIVDDCSTEKFDFGTLIQRYGDILKLQILRMPQNGGPGLARQYGIDHTEYPLMTFIDADDTLAGAYALQQLRNDIYTDYDNIIAAWGTFIEEAVSGGFYPHKYQPVWMFGKLYKRSFWEENNIKFHPTSRYNEDTGVNTMIHLLSNETNKKIYREEAAVYYWMASPKTITRNYGDVDDYWDNNCLIGYAENLAYAFNVVKEKQGITQHYHNSVLGVMMHLYLYYTRAYDHKAYKLKDCAEMITKFYEQIYKEREEHYTKADKIQMFDQCVKSVGRVIPYINYDEFIERIKNGNLF